MYAGDCDTNIIVLFIRPITGSHNKLEEFQDSKLDYKLSDTNLIEQMQGILQFVVVFAATSVCPFCILINKVVDNLISFCLQKKT